MVPWTSTWPWVGRHGWVVSMAPVRLVGRWMGTSTRTGTRTPSPWRTMNITRGLPWTWRTPMSWIELSSPTGTRMVGNGQRCGCGWISTSRCRHGSSPGSLPNNALNQDDGIDGIVPAKRDSISNTLGLRLSCTNPSACPNSVHVDGLAPAGSACYTIVTITKVLSKHSDNSQRGALAYRVLCKVIHNKMWC